VQAQYEANLRDWTPLVALQIEYSLLQRTVEADLMPMARALNLGVTPWSPLRGGVLSGKFDRANPPKDDGSTRVRSDSKFLNERAFAIIDALREIAAARGATPSQVALRWVMDRAGVASTIIGARTLAQLDDNLAAAALRLAPDDTRRLDELSRVELPFPCDFLEFVRTGIQNGTTINGQPSDPWPLSPKSDAERF
jgi:aryl-alcohol dehydrogenase-like predicted oxidoreductase